MLRVISQTLQFLFFSFIISISVWVDDMDNEYIHQTLRSITLKFSSNGLVQVYVLRIYSVAYTATVWVL